MATNIKEQLEATPGAALVEFYDATRAKKWPVCAYKREDCDASREHSHGTYLAKPADGWPDIWLWDEIEYRLVIKDASGNVIDPQAAPAAEPEPVEIPEFLQASEPEAKPETPDPRLDLQAARIAELESELDAIKKQATDMFDADALADLVRENEPHSEAQIRWQSDYNQLNNRLVDPRLPPLSDAERALLNRLQKALYAGRKGAVGII